MPSIPNAIWFLQSDVFQSKTDCLTREKWRLRLNFIHWELIRQWEASLCGRMLEGSKIKVIWRQVSSCLIMHLNQSLLLSKAAFMPLKYSKNCEIYQFNNCFLCEYMLKCNWFLWSKLNFQHHYSSLQCHMIFRNHSNMLICCSRNISDYYQCWKQLCCPIFLWKRWYILFFRLHRWIENSKEQHLFEI